MHIAAPVGVYFPQTARAALAICTLVVVGLQLFWRKKPGIRAGQPLPLMRGKPPRVSHPTPASPWGTKSAQLSELEARLRNAIFDPGARERLVDHAMRTTGGDRAAAIRKVLDDLYREDARWS